jgi:hypothetical protein
MLSCSSIRSQAVRFGNQSQVDNQLATRFFHHRLGQGPLIFDDKEVKVYQNGSGAVIQLIRRADTTHFIFSERKGQYYYDAEKSFTVNGSDC